MRENKFRAWDADAEHMVYSDKPEDDYVWDVTDKGIQCFAIVKGCDDDGAPCFDSIELSDSMEYTGLKSKSGVDIFEDDFIRCKKYIGGNFIEYHYEIGYVEFDNAAFKLHRKQGLFRPLDWIIDYEFEVIGNRHNDDLIEARP